MSFCRLSPLFFKVFYTVLLLNIITLKAVIDVCNVLQNLMSSLSVLCPTQQRFIDSTFQVPLTCLSVVFRLFFSRLYSRVAKYSDSQSHHRCM